MTAADRDLAAALFAPRTVALIGASGDPRKATSRPQRFLARHGFAGRVIPVNPGRDEILGLPCLPHIGAARGRVDHAFILVGTAEVPAAVTDCAAAGVTCATILSGGFAEAGPDGLARQADLVARARAGGMRLVGPNSIGVIDTRSGLALSANAVLELPALRTGRLGVVSQSGSMIGALVSRGEARGHGFSALVSTGNEADLGVGDFVELLAADAGTDAILLFLETVREPERLRTACAGALAAGKPVTAYRLGRSAAGRALAASHTGALAGSGAAIDAFLLSAGVVVVDTLEALLEAPSLLGRGRAMGRGRIVVATTTGGGGAMMVDALGARDLTPFPPPAGLVAALAGYGLALEPQAPLIDLTLAGARPETVSATIRTLMADDDVDAVVMVVGSSAQFHADLAVDPLLAFADAPKPLAVFVVPHAPDALSRLVGAGIAAFHDADACADALAAMARRRAPGHCAPAAGIAAAVLGQLPAPAGAVNEAAAARALGALGIPFAAAVATAADPEAAAAAAGRLGGPVALKILSGDLPHKTEMGGVALALADGEAVAGAARVMLASVARAAPRAAIDGFLVQRMARGLAELLIGFRRDPAVGPVVTVAMGGILAEIYRDAAVRPAPVDPATARAMLAELRGLRIATGYRGLPRGDLGALADAVAALSQLAAPGLESIAEAEINPLLLLAEGEGVVAVDALVLRA
ncbi:MAG: acetate--CoA ligase family protein [Sneathiellaceae bacterium]